ncbi:MAG: DUF2127 domain-containing protein [Candidatus Moranbacteria bacterium]|jgi:uncharacterized membrane protein|nr:DUF2127 domain-containing protein [Candidatus Moranbacteria bacterium]
MKKQEFLHESFLVTLAIKAIDAIVEIAIGIVFFFVNPNYVNNFINSIIQVDVSDDPVTLASGYFSQLLSHLNFSANLKFFVVFYLLSHGIAKLLVVIFLWMKKLWAYPVGIVLFFFFIVYQIYRYSIGHSMWMIVLTIFDLIIIYLTWVEYNRIKYSSN